MTALTLFGPRIQHFADRDAWLAAREHLGAYRIGATAARAVLGHGYADEGPWSVWARHCAPQLLRAPTAEQQRDFSRGRRHEEAVRDGYVERMAQTDVEVDTGLCIVSAISLPWACCSPDGIVPASPDGPGLVEVKTVRSWDDWGTDGAETKNGGMLVVPLGVAAQVYWQLAVTDLRWCDVAACGPYWEERTVRIWADWGVQDDLITRISTWRTRHLVSGEQPEHDGSPMDRRWLASRHPAGSARRQATAEEESAVRDYAGLGAEIKRLEARRAGITAAILASAGDATALLLDGGARCTVVRAQGRRTVAGVGEIEKYPSLYQALSDTGLIRTGAPTTSLRVSGLGEE